MMGVCSTPFLPDLTKKGNISFAESEYDPYLFVSVNPPHPDIFFRFGNVF
jgi:hypothetical protein